MRQAIWVDGYWDGNPKMMEDLTGHIIFVDDLAYVMNEAIDLDMRFTHFHMKDGRTLISTADFDEIILQLGACCSDEDRKYVENRIRERQLRYEADMGRVD